MIKVGKSEKKFTLDLGKLPYDEHEIKIDSRGGSGKHLPWGVEFTSSDAIKVEPVGNDVLSIKLDSEALMTDEYIVLRNYAKERLRIEIKHNLMVSAPKKYNFKISKKTVDGKKARIRILSKENGNEIGWKCTYDGKPLTYVISPMESDKSGYVDIELKDDVYTSVNSVIEFTQDKSGEVIQFDLIQDKEEKTD